MILRRRRDEGLNTASALALQPVDAERLGGPTDAPVVVGETLALDNVAALGNAEAAGDAVTADEGSHGHDPERHGHTIHLPHTLHLPSPKAFVRHALPSLVESTLGPGALFYIVLVMAGFRGAIIAAVVWAYLALGRRIVRRQRVPGVLLLGIALISFRTIISFATGSAFIYFAQPTLGTALVAVLFLASVLAGRPLAERLAHDFCPLDPDVMSRPLVRKFFLRISLMWFAVLAVESGFVMWLLVEVSLRSFVLERMLVSTVLTVAGIVLSTLWFLRVMRGAGITVRWSRALHPLAGTAPTT